MKCGGTAARVFAAATVVMLAGSIPACSCSSGGRRGGNGGNGGAGGGAGSDMGVTLSGNLSITPPDVSRRAAARSSRRS